MFSQWLRYLAIALVAASLSWVRAFGSSPAEDRLLRLVPANAEIVAGIEDPHHRDQSGRLLIVTHSNNVDLEDWRTLAGVDDRQEVDKLIQVALSSPRGALSEHLLLLQGSFNGRFILDSAERNGGVPSSYQGVRVVILAPFARERQEMPDTRWLAIAGDGTVIFGTPAPVKSALERYVSQSGADGHLIQRLRDLKPDVNCWSMLTMPGAVLTSHLRAGVLDETGSTLLRRVAVGVHYGSKERVDFAFSADSPQVATALAASLGAQPHLLQVANAPQTRFEGVSVEQNEVRGSVRVKDKEFDGWLAAVYARLAVGEGASGGDAGDVASAR
jgi:hypothetical protein